MRFCGKDVSLYEEIEDRAECFDDLSEKIKKDLVEWLNAAEPTDDDKKRLLDLYKAGKFQAWGCEECKEKRVFWGDPDDYDHFQGCLNQDFSYFGNAEKFTEEYINAMCDSCRCHC